MKILEVEKKEIMILIQCFEKLKAYITGKVGEDNLDIDFLDILDLEFKETKIIKDFNKKE